MPGDPTRASERVLGEWAQRVTAEYRSAALTAQVVHWCIQVGLDDPLVRTALRIVGDELDHADLSHDCWVALGGDGAPRAIDVAWLAAPEAAEGPLASLLDSVVRSFCLGETFAVPLFAAIRRGTRHPACLPVLDRVLRDESVHRQFGWDALDALLEVDAPGARARVQPRLAAWIAEFRSAYADGRAAPPLAPEERAAGLLDLHEYARIFEDTLGGTIRRRFAARGLVVPA